MSIDRISEILLSFRRWVATAGLAVCLLFIVVGEPAAPLLPMLTMGLWGVVAASLIADIIRPRPDITRSVARWHRSGVLLALALGVQLYWPGFPISWSGAVACALLLVVHELALRASSVGFDEWFYGRGGKP